jgi:beta-galactosidase
MEMLNQGTGFTLYRAKTTNGGDLDPGMVRDRAYIFVDKIRYDIIDGHGKEHHIQIPQGNLDILVENEGRTNGGTDTQAKGLLKTPTIGGKEIDEWENVGINIDRWDSLPWSDELQAAIPSFYKAKFTVDEVGDTFLNPKGWKKGIAWVNGFNLGRYWTIGPQLTLYVPKGVLRKGENELVVFEFESSEGKVGSMSFDDVHQISII